MAVEEDEEDSEVEVEVAVGVVKTLSKLWILVGAYILLILSNCGDAIEPRTGPVTV